MKRKPRRPQSTTANAEVGARIRARRTALKLSREDIAPKVGYSAVSVWRMENGQQGFDLERLSALASALDTTVAWLLGHTEDVHATKRAKKAG